MIISSNKSVQMKTTSGLYKDFLFLCFLASHIFLQTSSASSSVDQVCGLNFSSFSYEPSGDCINGVKEKISDWNGIPTTGCCQNAFQVLSRGLALQAMNGEGNLFIHGGKWIKNCDYPFERQPSISIENCGFGDLSYGESLCSRVNLSTIKKGYPNVFDKCTSFQPSFDFGCRNCTDAIVNAREQLLYDLDTKKNLVERGICTVAIVVAVAALSINNQSAIEDFYRCLPALNYLDHEDYIKIKSSVGKILLAIFLACFGMMLVVILVKYVTKNGRKKRDKRPKPNLPIGVFSSLYRFSKAEIENAIFYGTEKKCLGRGSAGVVYKGILPSGQVVAIKHITATNTSDSFRREVEGLSRVRHPNLVCLFGCCLEDGEQYLVYEYCSSGNLAQHLLKKDAVLKWERRVKILRDCALALRYLHHYVDGCIVHRDIKLTNILLTERMEPKLSDFGLAKVLEMEESKVFTDVRGTIGYMDPEYMSNAKLTCASDIYSFGIVALQVLSGQKVIELDLDARDQLTRKAKDVSMGKRPLKDFEDPRLEGNLNTVDFESILQLAVLCVAKSSDGRPSIDIVFEELDKAWKNTVTDMRTRSKSATHSRSVEIIPV